MNYKTLSVKFRTWGFIALTLFAGSACNAQPGSGTQPEGMAPRILKAKSDVSVAGAHDWIAFQHTGIQDKPIPDFVIIFSTGLTTPGGAVHYAALTDILVLGAEKRDPIMKFILDPQHTTSHPTSEAGSFHVGIYTYLAFKEGHDMTPRQSKNFFGYLTSLLLKDADASDAVRKSTVYMNGFLSRLQ
jgi:hypothetical protein